MMGYQKSNHKNALLKLVKEKRMILQPDAKSVLNTTSIDYAVNKLSEEGKIKSEKIKVRYSQGNLNDVWLLFIPDVKHEEILDYERVLINRPFESPLKENHCYKSDKDPVKPETKRKRGRPKKVKSEITNETTEITKVNNVVDMVNYVKVNNCELGIKEYNNERVVTFRDIDSVHNRPSGTAQRNFHSNKKHFEEGRHYYLFKGKEGREALKMLNFTNFVELPNSNNFKFYLITEMGYLKIVKSLTDNLSWQVQDKLVESYFKLKEIKQSHSNNTPVDLNSIQLPDILEMIAKEFKNQQCAIQDQNNKIIELEGKFEALKTALA